MYDPQETGVLMSKQQLIHSLYQIGAIQFGEFTLKSGQISPFYINLRKIISYPVILRQVAQMMWAVVRDCPFDLICGIPYTALPIATCISLEQNTPMIMKRKEKKDYGTKQMIEGEFQEGQSCLIIEDVITTGSSVLETTQVLETAGLSITHVAALIDREQGGRERLSVQYHLHTIFSLSDILHQLIHSDVIDATQRDILNQLLQRPPC
jgi:orotate phosphoribosyltransferase